MGERGGERENGVGGVIERTAGARERGGERTERVCSGAGRPEGGWAGG